LCPGTLCCVLSLPTIKKTSANMSLLNMKARRSLVVLFVDCQLYIPFCRRFALSIRAVYGSSGLVVVTTAAVDVAASFIGESVFGVAGINGWWLLALILGAGCLGTPPELLSGDLLYRGVLQSELAERPQ
jgi:hypothetical protein